MSDNVELQVSDDELKKNDIVDIDEDMEDDIDDDDLDEDIEDDLYDDSEDSEDQDELGDEDALNRGDFKPLYFNKCRDNSVEWYTGQTIITATFSQRKWINKIRRLAEKHPDEVKIDIENPDSIVVHMPIGYIKISPPKKVSAEQRERMRLQAQKNIAEGKFGRKKKSDVTVE